MTSYFNFKNCKMLFVNFLIGTIALYILLCFFMYFYQERLVFLPNKHLDTNPKTLNLEYEDVYIKSTDNTKIHGWFIPSSKAEYTILLSHGNGGNISGELDMINFAAELNMNIFLYDYQGYGNSEGNPSEKGTYDDFKAAYKYLTNEKNIDNNKIIIIGRSLGGGVSLGAYSEDIISAGYILDSTFTSIVEMGKKQYPFLPINWLANIYYNNLKKIGKIKTPILIIHSIEDRMIPFKMAEELYRTAKSNKSILQIKGPHYHGFHNDDYKTGIKEFIQEYIINKRDKS